MYLLMSLLQLNALVAGNGSYILRPCGHDLHGPTLTSGADSTRGASLWWGDPTKSLHTIWETRSCPQVTEAVVPQFRVPAKCLINETHWLTVANPAYPGVHLPLKCAKLLFDQYFPKTCMKMKKFDPANASLAHPDPPLIGMQTQLPEHFFGYF